MNDDDDDARALGFGHDARRVGRPTRDGVGGVTPPGLKATAGAYGLHTHAIFPPNLHIPSTSPVGPIGGLVGRPFFSGGERSALCTGGRPRSTQGDTPHGPSRAHRRQGLATARRFQKIPRAAPPRRAQRLDSSSRPPQPPRWHPLPPVTDRRERAAAATGYESGPCGRIARHRARPHPTSPQSLAHCGIPQRDLGCT